jgi:hypothetical protein
MVVDIDVMIPIDVGPIRFDNRSAAAHHATSRPLPHAGAAVPSHRQNATISIDPE